MYFVRCTEPATHTTPAFARVASEDQLVREGYVASASERKVGLNSMGSPLVEPYCSRHTVNLGRLGPPARCPFTISFLGESPTKIDYRKKMVPLL